MSKLTLIPRTDIIEMCAVALARCDEVLDVLQELKGKVEERGGYAQESGLQFYDREIARFRGVKMAYLNMLEWARDDGWMPSRVYEDMR